MNPVKKIGFDENSTPPKNMIGYRGEGKFYEGKNNDGVLCYNLVDVASQEQLERNNYVIAQVLNDLNERIGGLQSQVAQQDHLYIETPDSFDTANSWSLSFFEQLEEKYKAGVLLDVVLTSGEDRGQILSYWVDGGELQGFVIASADGMEFVSRPKQ